MSPRAYQPGFYDLCPQVHNREERLKKANKIAYFLKTFPLFPEKPQTCLDVGCSSGIITASLAPLFSQTIGIDYDTVALSHIAPLEANLALFIRADALHMPIADCSVDVAICAQVYEHVPDDEQLFAEIHRVLRPGGIVFFSGPNKLFPIELHYGIPFLHWLPSGLADRCLWLLRRRPYYHERSKTMWGLRRLTSRFQVRDITIQVLLEHPQSTLTPRAARVTSLIPKWIWRLLLPWFPNFNWILYKPTQ